MSEPRLNYVKLAPEGIAALRQFEHYLNTGTALDQPLRDLVRLRASQLNGCNFCKNMHAWEMKQHHEPGSRIEAVAHWRDSDAFTQRERAALAWTEVLTNINSNSGSEPVSDEAYATVRQHFDDKDLVDLSLTIAGINAWNRLGTAFQPQWREPGAARAAQPQPAQAPPTETK